MKLLNRPALLRAALACTSIAMLGIGLAAPASATTVSGTYTGRLTDVPLEIGGQFAVNDTFTFNFSYDSTVLDSDPNPNFGVYNGALTIGSGSIGGYTFSGGPGDIFVNNTAGGDSIALGFLLSSGANVNGLIPFSASLTLQGPSSLLSSEALPSTFLAASLFSSTNSPFVMNLFNPSPFDFFSVIGQLNTAPVAATPIPAALPLFMSALAGLGFTGWRRRQAQAAA